MSRKTAVERLTELADGWDCAAKAEQGVLAAFQESMELFNAGRRDPMLLRHVRVFCEARDNRDRFEKDAAAIRWVLSALAKAHPGEEE